MKWINYMVGALMTAAFLFALALLLIPVGGIIWGVLTK